MDRDDILEALSSPFADVKWRLQQTYPKNAKDNNGKYLPGTKGLFMAYIDVRDVYDRLDHVVGFGKWERIVKTVNPDGSVIGRLRVKIEDEWIEHEDIGYSNSPGESYEKEPLKAAASDAFKRAAVGLGIGRFLYELDAEWVEIDERGKPKADLNRKVGNAPVASPDAPGRTEAPRKASTSTNTIPAGIPDEPDEPPDEPGIIGWTQFWVHANAAGFKTKPELEKQMGQSLGADPAYALERFQAWRKDMAEQKVMPS